MNETYGKLFPGTYSGSMFGAGVTIFALWPWCIANKDVEGRVEINPDFLAAVFGCTAQDVRDAAAYLLRPDPNSRTKTEDGRRLIQVGQFEYQVVNSDIYRDRGRNRSEYWKKRYQKQKKQRASK